MIDKIRPFSLLIGRVVLGAVFLVHGLQKFTGDGGIAGVTGFFTSLGVPLPGVAAPVVAILEVGGGIALILGAALPIVGTLLAVDMLGAIVLVHFENGFSVSEGGYEFVLTLAAASLVIAFSEGGALAVDNIWRRKRALAVVR
ncbi:DoxX family protein [Nonomuraea endophytica]|uniref:Putative oxidoreductase n=1 Tax=Nonomuraea endophytica TaxID=714136 RepID=A0A7W8A7C4_9ACTN|nr:DoxX family protein [Nonomuraea endophytica]MBB5079986.1 putative oxidoreductase [Nonomuraea endophytica]